MIDLTALDERTRGEVMAAVAAVETAEAPVAQRDYQALEDAALRRLVEEALHAAGRCLIDLGDGLWISGYDDQVTDTLTAEDIGNLDPVDRAVLALVLLHTVAIPRAEGRIQSRDWTVAEPTDLRTLCLNRRIGNGVIQASVRRLKARGILRRGHRADIVPGPQFLRLTEAHSRALWEDLVVLCKPDGARAAQIRRNRTRDLTAATA
jgi:hypothetical protein